MKSGCVTFLVALVSLVAVSCTQGPPQLMPMESLFPLGLGTLEDQVDLFARPEGSSPEGNRVLFYNGLIVVSDGNARKIMEFSSYGDLLTLFYNPDTNPIPALLASGQSAGTPGQVRNRQAFAYPFDELGEIALNRDDHLFVEDRVPSERRAFDSRLSAVLQSRILRFGRDGKFLDFLGQEGTGGTPFPSIERMTVTNDGDLIILSRTGKGWAFWWFNSQGVSVKSGVLLLDQSSVPRPEGQSSSQNVAQLENVYPDWQDKRLWVKVDYYGRTSDGGLKTDATGMQAQSRIWSYDLATEAYKKSYSLPVLKRQKQPGEVSNPAGDRPFEFVGVADDGLAFFLSSPEGGSLRFLVCNADGGTVLERSIELNGADQYVSQFSVTANGILLGFLSDGKKAQIAWWRSDRLLGTYAGAGF